MKIITLTVNPALDKSAKIDGLFPEQKLSCHSIMFQAGGGGINISRILNRLDEPSNCMFTSGGDNGKHLEKLLLEEKIKTFPIVVSNATRENFSVVDTNTNQQYRFGMPGANLADSEIEQIVSKVVEMVEEQDLLVLSGSLQPNMPSDFYVQLMKLVRKKKVRIVLDTSGSALKEAVNYGVSLVKPNQKELAQLAGKDFLSNKEQEDFAMHLVHSHSVEFVVVSMGARGAFMASKEGIVYQPSPSIPVKSTIGAGDSMVAGLIYGIKHNLSPKEMLKYGVACGSATTMSEGTGLGSRAAIEKTLHLLS
jgi:6-phosphofructokinase 2